MEDTAPHREAIASLDEIDHALHQMLMLAELSAGEGDINRENLQKVFEYLKIKINRSADRLDRL